MSQIRLRIVGECVIELGDRRLTPSSPQLFALLLFLATEHDREVSRAELIDLLYIATERAAGPSHRLRQSLHKLRGMGAPIVFGDRSVKVEGAWIRSDVADLLSADWETRREQLVGSFQVLPHYAPSSDTSFSGWVERLRERLQNALRQQLTRDVEMARRKADWRYLESIAHRILELDPLNETGVLALAEVTARTGSKARAVSILDAYRAELGEERASLALPATLLQKRIDASRDRLPLARREPVPMIGRERELESLLSQWQSARRGSAHVLWLSGNKSIGKSRLGEELAATAIMSGSGQVITFPMSPVDADRPLSLIAALANRLSALPGAAGCDPQSLTALGRLSGSISLPSTVNPENNNAAYSDVAIRNAICDLVACVCDERSVLVIVDDAQYLDEASEHLLDAVLKRVSNKRLLVVLCGSPERSAGSAAHGTMHVDPLSSSASEQLWQALLGARDVRLPDNVSRQCLDAAAGNPGHMELLAQQAAQDPEQFLIPADLIALTDRRLSQLPAHARYALEATMVLGDAATTSSISHVTGLGSYDLLTALHVLESSDLVVDSTSGPRCRSSLIADRIRATSSSTVLSLMEGRAAEYLEKEQSGDRWTPSMAWRIAAHWQRAGEQRRARAYLRACWQHAVSIGQPARASDAIAASLLITTDPDDRASLLDDLIGTLQATGDLSSVLAAVRERRSLSLRVHDTGSRLAQLAFDEVEASLLQSSNPAAHVSTLKAHLASSHLNSRRRIRAARLLMMAADGELDPLMASYATERCQQIIPQDPYDQLLQNHVFLIYHAIFGDSNEALRLADEIQDQAKVLERSWYTAMSDRNCAFARQLAGPGPSDYASFERAFVQTIDASMTPAAIWYAGSIMSVAIDDGDMSRAEAWRDVAEELSREISPTDYPVDYLGAQVDLSLLAGNNGKARQYLALMQRCSPRYQSLRHRNELFIYGLRVQLFCGELTSPSAHLPRLLDYHERGKTHCRHDDHMSVLWETLNAAGEAETASTLLADYLARHRRERRPCRYLLRIRTQSDPAWLTAN